MSDSENTQSQEAVPVSRQAILGANPNTVFSFGISEAGENGNLTVPTDSVLSGRALDFFPNTFDINQQSTGPSYSGSIRYERDIIPVPEQGGFYLRGGADATLSVHNGSFNLDAREPIDIARSNVKAFARDEISGIRSELISAGITNPDSIIGALHSASDSAIGYVLENPTEIRNFDATAIEIPDHLPAEARQAIEGALESIDRRLSDPTIQNGLEAIEDANVLYDNGRQFDYQAYGLSAGVFVEAGNAVRDVSLAGIDIDQVDYFAAARVGYGATVYNMGDDGIYGCYGPEASASIGVRAHFNDRMAGVVSADHTLSTNRHCPGGVTQSLEGDTSLNIGVEIKTSDPSEPTVGTGEGRSLMSF